MLRWSAGLVLLAWSMVAGAGPAGAQLFPTTTTTAPTQTTVTTVPVPTTTTTVTTAPPSTTTTAATPATTAAPPATTVTTAATTSTAPLPEGVSSTTAPTEPEEILEADTGNLPLFVTLSLGGFAVAILIMTVQWVRTRPRRATAG